LKAQGTARVRGESPIVAQDVTAQVEFNPTRVTSYRLVGYGQALSAGAPGEIHSGDAVTLLYEVVPSETLSEIGEAASVKVHYKSRTSDQMEVAQEFVVDEGQGFAGASPDFKFAAAVAEFGMFLRDSSVEDRRRLVAIAEMANNAVGVDPDRRRAAFVELIRQTQLLTRG
jgi:Ca-activated chloride channel family protein